MINAIKKEKLYWICQVGGWFLFTILELSTYIDIDGLTPKLITNAVAFYFLGISVTHFYRLVLIKLGWLQLPLYKIIPRGLMGVLLMSVLLSIINIQLDQYTYSRFESMEITIPIFLGYFFNLSKYILLWSLTYHLFQYWERSLKAERDRYQLEAVLKDNQYQNLKTQLNPHFLFNSLNSIRTLIDMDPELSKTAITKLSGLLRSSLQAGKHKTVTLEQELQTVTDYLAIEKIRFDERLQMQFDIAPETNNLQVPPLMIQTLVENAVKHGISTLKQGGTIRIKSTIANEQLVISITNSGQFVPKNNHDGLGIENTKQRLAILFDEQGTFTIDNIDLTNVKATLSIPI